MEEDISNFNISSPHRLPTVSASQALQKLSSPRKQWVPTGLPRLDEAFRSHNVSSSTPVHNPSLGGFPKGQLTEIYGPPGSGKTALALQAATGALHANGHVAWIDCHYRIAGHRIKNVLANCVLRPSSSTPSSPPPVQSLDDLQDHLHHFAVPTLPHLLALICYPPPSFPPQGTTLVVIDGVSSLFGAAFPDRPDAVAKSGKKQDDVQWASNRRFTIMAEFLTRLARLAAVRNLAVVLVSQTSIKVRQDFGAILRPAIPSKSWLDNINNRIVVFRDFFRASSDLSERIRVDVRFTGIVKLNGTLHSDLISAIPFSINKTGIHELQTIFPKESLKLVRGGSPPKLKRKRTEIADSESDDGGSPLEDNFDWVEDDALALGNSLEDGVPTVSNDHTADEDIELEAT